MRLTERKSIALSTVLAMRDMELEMRTIAILDPRSMKFCESPRTMLSAPPPRTSGDTERTMRKLTLIASLTLRLNASSRPAEGFVCE